MINSNQYNLPQYQSKLKIYINSHVPIMGILSFVLGCLKFWLQKVQKVCSPENTPKDTSWNFLYQD